MKKTTLLFACLVLTTSALFCMKKSPKQERELFILGQETNDQLLLLKTWENVKKNYIKPTDPISGENVMLYAAGKHILDALNHENAENISLFIFDNVTNSVIEKFVVTDKPIVILCKLSCDNDKDDRTKNAHALHAGIIHDLKTTQACVIVDKSSNPSLSFLQENIGHKNNQQTLLADKEALLRFRAIHQKEQISTSNSIIEKVLTYFSGINPKIVGTLLIISLAGIYVAYKAISR